MGTYLHRKLSTCVLKINIFNIGKRYGINNKTNMCSCLIATSWMMSHLKCPIQYDIFEDCSLLKGTTVRC